MADRYWVGGTANWDATAGSKWASTSGGAGGQAVPTTADNVFFDASSGSSTITINAAASCANINLTGFVGTIAGSSAMQCAGSFTAGIMMTLSYTGTITFISTSTGNIITTQGFSMPSIVFNGVGGEWTLADNYLSAGNITLTNGSFSDGNFDLSIGAFVNSGTSTRTLTMGSGTWTLKNSGAVWNTNATGLTFTKGTGAIKLTNNSAGQKQFTGGGLTYNNFWNATLGAGNCLFTDSNNFEALIIDVGRTQKFTAGTTMDIVSLSATGSAGNLITITSATTATHTLNFTGGPQSNDYINISYSVATGASSYAGANSVDGGNNTGWIFSAPAGPVNLQSFNGESKASIATINGVAIANISAFNGV